MSTLPKERARRIFAAGIPFGPRFNPCVCTHGQHAHSGKQSTGKCSGPDCDCGRYRADQAWTLAYAAHDGMEKPLGHSLRDYDQQQRAAHGAKNPRKPGEWSLGPSDAGTCRRAIWYRNMPPVDLVKDPVDGREARMGDIIHEDVVRRLKTVYPWREFEQKVAIPGLDRDARYDWYDEIIARVTDLKTAGDWKWDQVDDYGVPEDTVKQVFLYGLALHLQGKPVETVEITYLKRCNGHDQTFVFDFNLAMAQMYRDELLVIAQALDIVAAEQERYEADQATAHAEGFNPDQDYPAYDPGELLPRDRSGPSTDPLCRRCPFRSHCWNLVQAEEHGRSGESWTILGPEPVPEDVLWALEQNVGSKALEGDAKKAAKEYAAFFEGLEPGRYGDYRLVQSQDYGSKPQYKQHVEDLHARLLAGEVPDVETLQIPIGEPAIYLQAKRVQKSILDKEKRQREKAELEAALAAEQTTEVSA